MGDGESNFWIEPWFENSCIALEIPFVDVHAVDLRVRGVINDEGACDLSFVYTCLLDDLHDKL